MTKKRPASAKELAKKRGKKKKKEQKEEPSSTPVLRRVRHKASAPAVESQNPDEEPTNWWTGCVGAGFFNHLRRSNDSNF